VQQFVSSPDAVGHHLCLEVGIKTIRSNQGDYKKRNRNHLSKARLRQEWPTLLEAKVCEWTDVPNTRKENDEHCGQSRTRGLALRHIPTKQQSVPDNSEERC